MSITLTISGTPYSFPTSGQEPDWGENVSNWAQAVTDALSGLNTTGDILTTSFSPADNQVLPANVVGFSFDSSQVQGFIAEYSIYRTDGSIGFSETGNIYGTYNAKDGAWTIAQTGVNIENCSVLLTITSGGQLQYTSSSLGGTHSCKMVFRARALPST